MTDAIAWQERIDKWSAIARYKAVMDDLIGTAVPELEIGVGPTSTPPVSENSEHRLAEARALADEVIDDLVRRGVLTSR